MKILMLSVSALGIACGPAIAQEYYSRDKYTAVTDRAQPEFDPDPMRWGSFFVQPTFDLSLTSDSNVFAASENEESDVIVHAGISLDARSNWNNHKLGLKISGRQNEYLDIGSESNFDFRTRVNGQLDVLRSTALVGEVFYEDRTQARTEVANRAASERPIEFDTIGVRAGIQFRNDRTRLSANITVDERDYKDGQNADGTEFDQDFRDRTTTTGVISATYAVTPNVAVFAQGRTISREYETETTLGGVAFVRDTSGYDIQAGADFELNALLRGRLGVGYLEESRDDSRFQNIDGLSVDGLVTWFPSQLVTVTFNASRRSEDQGLLEVPSAIATNFGAQIDFEARRNLILSARGEVGGLDFDEIDRSDEFQNWKLGATYKANKRVHLEAFVRLIDRDTDGFASNVGQSFEKSAVGIGLKLFPY